MDLYKCNSGMKVTIYDSLRATLNKIFLVKKPNVYITYKLREKILDAKNI